MTESQAGFSMKDLIHHIADYTTDAIVVCEAEPIEEPGPRILYVNPAFTAMTGYSASEVLGRSPRFLQGDDTCVQTKQRIRHAFRRWQPVRAELLNFRKDGSRFWVDLSIVPVADVTGWFRYWVAVQRDISERRQFEESLKLQEQIMCALDDGILVINATQPSFPVEYINEQVEKITGYRKDEFLGRSARFLCGPDTDQVVIERLKEAIRSGSTVTTELLNYRKDGTSFLNLLTLSPMFNNEGRLIKFIGVFRDITEIHQRKQEMVIAQRVKAVGELAGGIAHDFNNLLTSILGSADLLSERLREDTELNLLAESIRNAAQRGASQVRRLMSLTRTPTLNQGAVNLTAITGQLSQLLKRSLRDNIVLKIDIDPQANWVNAEPVQLESALLNLVINAQDAMPQGGAITMVSKKMEREGHTWVCLTVSDGGCGMAPETLQCIFDPFFTTKEPGQGAGLGLAMVHSFVTQMGGAVHVSSELGKGTSLTLCLKPVDPDQLDRLNTDAVKAQAPDLSLDQERKVVLLVEDDPVVRITARAMLERLGHAVIESSDADQALEVLQSDLAIDLLFTDLLMPGGMNGRDLCLKAQELRPGLPQLQTSGWADATLEGKTPGKNAHFIGKPFTLNELSEAIGRV